MTHQKKDIFTLELSDESQLPGNTFQVSDVIISNQLPTFSNMISHYEIINFDNNSINIRLYLNIDCSCEEFEKYILKNFTFSCYNYQVGKYLSLNINHFE
jgi:hypothetical protein